MVTFSGYLFAQNCHASEISCNYMQEARLSIFQVDVDDSSRGLPIVPN